MDQGHAVACAAVDTHYRLGYATAVNLHLLLSAAHCTAKESYRNKHKGEGERAVSEYCRVSSAGHTAHPFASQASAGRGG